MIVTAFLAAGLAFGCGGGPMDTELSIARGGRYTMRIDTLGVEVYVGLTAGEAWAALPAALKDIGLEVNYRVPEERRIGVCAQKLRSQLRKVPLSEYIDCGATRTLPNANRFDVALTVLVTVVPQGNRSALYVFVLASAVDASGPAADPMWCRSTGELEQRIQAAVLAQASG